MKFFKNILNKILSANDPRMTIAYATCYSHILTILQKNVKVNIENYSAKISPEHEKTIAAFLDSEDLLEKQISFTNLALGISYKSKEDSLEAKKKEFEKEIYKILTILAKNKLNVLSLDIYTIALDDKDKFSFTLKINPLILPKDTKKITNIDLSKFITVTNI